MRGLTRDVCADWCGRPDQHGDCVWSGKEWVQIPASKKLKTVEKTCTKPHSRKSLSRMGDMNAKVGWYTYI